MHRSLHQPGRFYRHIAELLNTRDRSEPPDSYQRTRAAVAMILQQSADDLEVLFIRRATHERDPWSGHIAFPGGKLEPGEHVYHTACRETQEEIGIDLRSACYLGRLSDIVGANLPVRVSCCVFALERDLFPTSLNEEVSELFWISCSELRSPRLHLQADVAFDERRLKVPAIRLPGEERPVLWGITYRLLMQFFELLDRAGSNSAEVCKLPATVELDREEETK